MISIKANCQKFYGGLHGGINGSQIWGDQMSGFNKGGLIAGVFIDYPWSQNAFFTMELNYTEKGSRSKDGTSQTAGSWTLFKISYLEVPLLYNYSFAEKLDLNIGLYYGIKVGHNYIDSLGSEFPEYDFTRSSDFGIVGGINYRLGQKFKISIRESASLITIGAGKSNPIWAKTNTGMINIVTSFVIKYYFLSPSK
jgi:hypothetical protein